MSSKCNFDQILICDKSFFFLILERIRRRDNAKRNSNQEYYYDWVRVSFSDVYAYTSQPVKPVSHTQSTHTPAVFGSFVDMNEKPFLSKNEIRSIENELFLFCGGGNGDGVNVYTYIYANDIVQLVRLVIAYGILFWCFTHESRPAIPSYLALISFHL